VGENGLRYLWGKGGCVMARWNVTVVVEYAYEVEADTYELAEKQGWEYEEYGYTAQVDSIECEEIEEEEEEDE
jgi:hypothetical protein